MVRRATVPVCAAALVAGVLTGLSGPATAVPKPGPAPTNPTDGQLTQARGAKAVAAATVGRLDGQIAAAQAQLAVLQGKQEAAEQQVAYALSQLADARTTAEKAQAAVSASRQKVADAHDAFITYMQATYMASAGSDSGTTGALLTANDPNQLLERSSLEQFQTEHQITALGQYQRATVGRSNADAAARSAVQREHAAANHARKVQQQAAADYANGQAAEQSLQQTLSQSETQLTAAQGQLASLNGQRAAFDRYLVRKAAYDRYQAEQQRLAAERAAREAARQRAAAKRAAARASHDGGGSGGHSNGGGGGGGGYSGPSAPSTGRWSAAVAATAVRRARSELGMPYAWAGGNSAGPTYGVCDPGNGAPYDCHVDGFDCSGLMLYAWGPYVSMPHLAASQYFDAGSYHPSIGSLRPGDMLFYSYNGSASGIHHVAMYIGGGQIIQAPYSGAYVEISSMYGPGSIFGATRPLT